MATRASDLAAGIKIQPKRLVTTEEMGNLITKELELVYHS